MLALPVLAMPVLALPALVLPTSMLPVLVVAALLLLLPDLRPLGPLVIDSRLVVVGPGLLPPVRVARRPARMRIMMHLVAVVNPLLPRIRALL